MGQGHQNWHGCVNDAGYLPPFQRSFKQHQQETHQANTITSDHVPILVIPSSANSPLK